MSAVKSGLTIDFVMRSGSQAAISRETRLMSRQRIFTPTVILVRHPGYDAPHAGGGHEMSEVDVDSLLAGAIDLHVHPSPSPFPRRLSVMEAAVQAGEAGFDAIGVKSHHHGTITDVLTLREATGPLPVRVLGGICLNQQVGGINPYAVEFALAMGARLVWFPTIAAGGHLELPGGLDRFPSDHVGLRRPKVVPVFTADRRPLPDVLDVLALIARADAILACGHLAAAEISALIPVAQAAGVTRILVNHPNFIVGAGPALCSAWAEQGVFIEHSLCHYVTASTFHRFSLETLLEYVSAVGAGRTVLSSDLGQAGNPTPVEGFRWIVAALAAANVDAPTIRQLVSASARALVD
jgi:hypothetical protein